MNDSMMELHSLAELPPADRLKQALQRIDKQRLSDLATLSHLPEVGKPLDQMTDTDLGNLTFEQRAQIILKEADMENPSQLLRFVSEPKIKRIISDMATATQHDGQQTPEDMKANLQKYHMGDLLAAVGIKSLDTYDTLPFGKDEQVSKWDSNEIGFIRRRGIFLALGNKLGVSDELGSLLLSPDLGEALDGTYRQIPHSYKVNLMAFNLATNEGVNKYIIDDLLQQDFLKNSQVLEKVYQYTGVAFVASPFYENHPDSALVADLFQKYDVYIPGEIELVDKWGIQDDINVINQICEDAITTQTPNIALQYLQEASLLVYGLQLRPPEIQRYQLMSYLASDPRANYSLSYLESIWPLEIKGVVAEEKDSLGRTTITITVDKQRLEEKKQAALKREVENRDITALMAQRDSKGKLDALVTQMSEDPQIMRLVQSLQESIQKVSPPDLGITPQDSPTHRENIHAGLGKDAKYSPFYYTAALTDLGAQDSRLRQNLGQKSVEIDSRLSVGETMRLGERLLTLNEQKVLPLEGIAMLANLYESKNYWEGVDEGQKARILAGHQQKAVEFLQTNLKDFTIPGLTTAIKHIQTGNLDRTDEATLRFLIDAMVKKQHFNISSDPNTYTFQHLVDSTLLAQMSRDARLSFSQHGGNVHTSLSGDQTMARPIENFAIENPGRKGNIILVSAPAGSGKSSFVRALTSAINVTYAGGLPTVEQQTAPLSAGDSAFALTPEKAVSDYIASTFGSGAERLAVKLKELSARPDSKPAIIDLDEILVGTITPERVRLAESVILTFGELFPNVTWVVISHDTQRYYRSLKLLEQVDSANFPHIQTVAIHPETHQPVPETIADGLGIHVAAREGMPQSVIDIALRLEENVESDTLLPIEVGDVLASLPEIAPTNESFITEPELKKLGFDRENVKEGIFGAVYAACSDYFFSALDHTVENGEMEKIAKSLSQLTERYADTAVSILTRNKSEDISRYYQLLPKFRGMDRASFAKQVLQTTSLAESFDRSPFGVYDRSSAYTLQGVFSNLNDLSNLVLDASQIADNLGFTETEKSDFLGKVALLMKNGPQLADRLAQRYLDRFAELMVGNLDEEKIGTLVESETQYRDFSRQMKEGKKPLEIMRDMLLSGNADSIAQWCTIYMQCLKPVPSQEINMSIKGNNDTDRILNLNSFMTRIFKKTGNNQQDNALSILGLFNEDPSALKKLEIDIKDVLNTTENEALTAYRNNSDLYFYSVAHAAVTRTDNSLGLNWNRAQKLQEDQYPVKMLGGVDVGLYNYLKFQSTDNPYVPRDIELPPGSENSHIIAFRGPNMAGKTQGMVTDMQMFLWSRLGDGLVPAQQCFLGDIDALQVSLNTARETGRLSTFMSESRDKAAQVEKALYFQQTGRKIFAAIDEPFNGIGEQDKAVLSAAFATIYNNHYLSFTNHDPLLNSLLNQIRVNNQELPWDMATVVPGFRIGDYGKKDLTGAYSEARDIFQKMFVKAGYPPEFVAQILKTAEGLEQIETRADEIQENLSWKANGNNTLTS